MASPATFADGIVVRVFPYRDTQFIVRIIGGQIGKISALIRYGKTSNRRFGARLDIFDVGTFELSQGRGSMLVLGSFQPKGGFHGLRSDLDKLTLASLVCEAYDHLTVDAGHHLELSHSHLGYYERLFHSLSGIDRAGQLNDAMRAAFFGLVDLLHLCGVLADSSVTPSTNRFQELMREVERHSEKKLETESAVLEVIVRLKAAAPRVGANTDE